MSKMMMGQIDHARGRIKTIVSEKRGPSPKPPAIRGGSDVLKAVREDSLAISPARLRQAFADFIAAVIGLTVVKTSGNYRNDYANTYKVGEGAPVTVEDALANIVYGAANEAEVARWEAEKEEYNRIGKILTDRSAVVEDAIVLGDQHAALLALQEFAAFDPAATLATL